LTTNSEATGEAVGSVDGAEAIILLGNEAAEYDGATSLVRNVAKLRGDLDSLRVRAGESSGGVFPYQFAFTDADDLTVDALAASSSSVSLEAAGTLTVNAAIDTVADVALTAVAAIVLNAPVTSEKGRITLTSESIDVSAPLAVTDRRANAREPDDIILRASAGDLSINANVSAKNGVRLEQRDAVAGTSRQYKADLDGGGGNQDGDNGDKVSGQAIGRRLTVPIEVPQAFTYDSFEVSLGISVADAYYVTATLVTPSNARYLLFSYEGLRSSNFTNTVIATDATVPIRGQQGPFTGRFLAETALAPIVAAQESLGEWAVEFENYAYTSFPATLTKLSLGFINSEALPGAVSGVGLVSGDALTIIADGDVGNPSLPATSAQFYLNTAVSGIQVESGGAVALSERDRLSTNTISAGPGKLVALRALGRDQDPSQGGRPALSAVLQDVDSIHVTAPNGSVDLLVQTADDVALGDAAAVATGTSLVMQAAGGVRVRTEGGSLPNDVFVFDAPTAGSGAIEFDRVWAIPSEENSFKYEPGVEGVLASTIQGIIEKVGENEEIYQPLPESLGLALGDRVLFIADDETIGVRPEVSGSLVEKTGELFVKVTENFEGEEKVTEFPVKDSSGNQLNSDSRNGWEPKAAYEVGDGKELIWWNESVNRYAVWTMTDEWVATGTERLISTNTTELFDIEKASDLDINNDGLVGLETVADTSVTVAVDGNSRLYAGAAAVRYRGRDVYQDQLPDYTPIAAGTISGVNTLVWKHTGGSLVVWTFDSDWNYTGSAVPPRPGSDAFVEFEQSLGVDLDGDDVVGERSTQTAAAVIRTDAAGFLRVGGYPITSGGVGVRRDEFPNWEAIAISIANDDRPQNRLLWQHSSGRLAIWTLDASWRHIGGEEVPEVGSPAFDEMKAEFSIDVTVEPNLPVIESGPDSATGGGEAVTDARTHPANGLYEVRSLGSTSEPWRLVRLPEYSTAATLPSNSFARELATGDIYQLRYDEGAPGDRTFGQVPTIVERQELTTIIETSDPNDTVQYIVSAELGANADSGSLGKMITLLEENSARIDQDFQLAFTQEVSSIRLVQELPEITKALKIDGGLRWSEGSVQRILWEETADASGYPTVSSYELTLAGDRIELGAFVYDEANAEYQSTNSPIRRIFVDGSDITMKRTGESVSRAELSNTPFDGLTFFGPNKGSVVTDLAFGNFANGPAVQVDGVEAVAVIGNRFGLAWPETPSLTGAIGNRAANQTGVRVYDSVDVLIEGNSVGPNDIGIELNDSEGTVLIDNEIGTLTSENAIGLLVFNSEDQVQPNLIGLPTVEPINVRIVRGERTIELGDALADWLANAYVGIAVTGVGIPSQTTIEAINADKNTITLSQRPVAGSGLNSLTELRFGTREWARRDSGSLATATFGNAIAGNRVGIRLNGGSQEVMGNQISDNRENGIEIDGGEHTIGQQLADGERATGANLLFGNGGWGVLTTAASKTDAQNLANTQGISGNTFFGPADGAPNGRGNIGIQWSDSGLRDAVFEGLNSRYQANTFTGIDAELNRHFLSGNLPLPSAPQNLVATLGADRVDLSWASPADPIDVVEGYAVFSGTSASGPWTLFAEYPANQRTASVTGLNAFVPYWFRVLGRNSSGDGAAEIVGPRELTGLPAGSLSVSAVVPPDGTIDLAWTYNPASSSSAEVTGYDIYQRLPADEWPQVPIATGVTGTTLTVDAGLVPGLSYQFRVVATNDTGDGAEANSAVVTPRVPADPPTGVSAIAGDTAATVFWTPPVSSGGTAITDYRVQFSTNDGVTWQNFTDGPGTDLQTTVGNLNNGLFYRFRVAAVTASGTLLGEWSVASLPVQPVGESAAPTDVTATPVVENGGNAIDVSWTAPTQTGGLPVQGYSLQYALFVEGGTPDWQTYSGNLVIGTQARVDGLINGKAYVFQVAAVTAQGTGDFSVPTAPATARGELLGPVNLQSSSTQTAITVAWDEPADGYGAGTSVNYEVEISLGGQSMTKLTNGARWTTFSGLPSGTTFTLRVRAVLPGGVRGDWSLSHEATTGS